MNAHDVRGLIQISQQLNVRRHQIPGDVAPNFGSALGVWGSHRAAIITAINLLNGTESAIKVTLSCPSSEL